MILSDTVLFWMSNGIPLIALFTLKLCALMINFVEGLSRWNFEHRLGIAKSPFSFTKLIIFLSLTHCFTLELFLLLSKKKLMIYGAYLIGMEIGLFS